MKRSVFTLLFLGTWFNLICAHHFRPDGDSIVFIPDSAFLAALIEEGVDTNGDSLISYEEALVVDEIEVGNNAENPGEISDLTGIEAFQNLVDLDCSYNQLTSLDISNLPKLLHLKCSFNAIPVLDVSNNTGLETLWCGSNLLTSLDVTNLSKLTSLRCGCNHIPVWWWYWTFDCSSSANTNQIKELDLTNNTELIVLECRGNALTGLDISNCPFLQSLDCSGNQIDKLNLSNNLSLEHLRCSNNFLTTLDLRNNAVLADLRCDHNLIEFLDVSLNTGLEVLFCSDNLLTSLNISQNESLNHWLIGGISCDFGPCEYGLRIENMPTLRQVCVMETPVMYFDSTGSPNVYFTTECKIDSIVFIPDMTFLDALIEIGLDANEDSLISYAEAEAVTRLEVNGYSRSGFITDLTGIEAFLNLEYLDCRHNKLTSLDVSMLTGLVGLDCSQNLINHLDVSQNFALVVLSCMSNLLTSLDVTNCISLESLWCGCNSGVIPYGGGATYCPEGVSVNQITSLDLSNNPLLKVLECGNNSLSSLDVSANSELYYLKINDMPELGKVCVYSDPLPWMCCDMMTGIDTTGSPDVLITTECSINTVAVEDTYNSFSLYPNPSDRLVNIEVGTSDWYHLEVRSLSGRLIFSKRMNGNTCQIDLSPYPKGVYMISVRSSDVVRTGKIIKL